MSIPWIPTGIYYLLARNKDRERAVVNEAMLCVTIGTLVFSLFLVLGGNRFLAGLFSNDQVAGYLLYLIPIVQFMLLSSVAGTVMVYTDRISFSAKYNVAVSLLKMTLLIASMLIFRTVMGTMRANAVLQIVFGGLSLFLIYRFMLPSGGSGIRLDSIKNF